MPARHVANLAIEAAPAISKKHANVASPPCCHSGMQAGAASVAEWLAGRLAKWQRVRDPFWCGGRRYLSTPAPSRQGQDAGQLTPQPTQDYQAKSLNSYNQ